MRHVLVLGCALAAGCDGVRESEDGATVCIDSPFRSDDAPDLVADTPMQVHARFIAGCRMASPEVSCDVEVDGTDVIVRSFETWEQVRCTEVHGREIRATCDLDALPAGEYRLVFGPSERTFSVPGPGQVCIHPPGIE